MISIQQICLSFSSRIAFLFFVLVTFTSIPTSTISTSNSIGNATDYMALLSFKSMITHDPNGALSSWNASIHYCDWSAVSCGKRHRRVTVVRLISRGLIGSLSPYVGNLSFLHEFSLWNNSFQGTIPHELGHLSRLSFLDLGFNNFNGFIPTNLSACSKLEKLVLVYNKLDGSIPKELSLLSRLMIFALDDNSLTGGIPPSLGNITSMEQFFANRNPLGGSIPESIGHWKSLTQFCCGASNLYGTIPHSIYNISLLTVINLSENQLTGSLPSDLGVMLPNLVHLQLMENQLGGLLPASISNCSKLGSLEMHENNFSGKLTIDFARLTDIQTITLSYRLHGGGELNEMKIIDTLKNCSRLQILSLHDCNLKGVLPRSIGNLSIQLRYLNLGRNRIHGNLPSSIGNLVGLTILDLAINRFTGKIPFTIGRLRKVQVASLQINHFSGPIPDVIGNLSSLNALVLNYNRLQGNIPPSLGNCHFLTTLYLSDNNLDGQIPKQLLQLSSLTIKLDISQNNLYGPLPTEVGDLNMLTFMDLSHNNLSGSIPSSLGSCTSLTSLYLDGNSFQGMIPPSLISLRGLVELNLSHNNLSGKIPLFLEHFSLDYLDLSFNDFEGEVSMNGVFANASAFSVLGNHRLCGGLVELGLPKCKEMEKHKKRFPLFIIAIVIAFALFSVLCFVYTWRKKKSTRKYSQSSMNERFLKVSYNQLLKATNGFSEANLIGEGGFSSVYKGILDHDDRVVAVKVLHLHNRGAHKSFLAECEAWRSIRHRNLLKIITSCSSVDFHGNDFKALVYEFMPNGSLHHWLHSSACTSRLNLFQRLNILIDVASAVDYLHNHCETAIIHGDLKPSNILLNDDMVAHVGDFGLARFVGTNSIQNSSSRIKGTIGYAAPEYGVGSEMTRSGDVYSFGILVLEMMTGKNPTDDIFNDGLSLHTFAGMALPDSVINIIDEEILEYAITMQSNQEKTSKVEECLASTIKIGVSCSLDSPEQRMNIENVVNELQYILDTVQNI